MIQRGSEERLKVTFSELQLKENKGQIDLIPQLVHSFNQSFVSFHFHVVFQVYKGYVDDPRNTDNSWMETLAVNFHDDKGDMFNEFKLQV